MRETGLIDVAAVEAFLDSHLDRPQVNRILHGFPSPRFWREKVSVDEVMTQRRQWEASSAASFSLYIGLPFCIRTDPDRCGYCLFPVEVFEGSGQLDIYLDHLELEGHLFRDFFRSLCPQTVYIGGGTPNLMRPGQYARMMEIVRGLFPGLATTTTITLEGIPQLFTREKLESMKAGGINRVSLGVQQLDDELNRLSGRKQTRRQVFDAIAWCRELEIPCNADLIFGWPRQTLKTMMENLEQLTATGIEHITHYELNIGGPTDFSLNHRTELPSPALTREMYRAARDFLRSRGYRQLTTYDFQKMSGASVFEYQECRRGFEREELWGWGFAGVSDFGGTLDAPGWSYVNHRKVEDYYLSLERGEFPVERGFAREAVDLRLNTLFKNLQGMEIDRQGYARRFDVDVVEEHAPIWQALADRGWCSITNERIELRDDGVYYVPLIQSVLSETRLEQLRQSVGVGSR